ncbi:unsaturated chondroitin disaccharide hydrolase [Paenibacillus sp. UNC496MF]|uniref:glycoside hydrolase family 88 protein n=1 Tax=Paenibacillus sp. UNC496MF TaxID=1502753 RepID=UPI0008F0524C|nr:glycoside hydrolase family 88 protein [Paenibacillus sp. UNC496MF]SFI39433.1 unsaturated chondroitin disaccharide hydrolase [Paenibacillus sp. UNC496MF]
MIETAAWNETASAAVWARVLAKVDAMRAAMGGRSPHVAGDNGKYDDLRLDWWTSGFWPGMLWLAHDVSGEVRFREAAWSWDERLERLMLEENRFDHDVGFQFLPTAVFKYALTGDEDARRRGLFAANFLAGRFNPRGGFIRAWNGDRTGWAIADTAMNLSLLFWAAKESGDPRFAHVAKLHADTVLREFIRPDGSAHHIVRFDPETGERADALGGQGAAPDSAWSRGNAWVLYGMANAFRHTGDPAYLQASQRVAHYFVAHLPEDAVPHWDFRADVELGGEPRDTSAGAIAASGLLELADALPEREGRAYRAAAGRILSSLDARYATWDRPDHEAILTQGTGHKPAGQNVNVSLIYGDYFFMEAVAKLNGWTRRIF